MDFHAFTMVDWIIVAVIALSTIVGLFRGFVREALSLVVWAVAFLLAFKLATPLSDRFLLTHVAHAGLRYGIAFAGVFIVVLIVGGLINYLVTTMVRKTGLGSTDRFLGLFFGFFRGALMIAVVLMIINISPAKTQPWVVSSKLLPRFTWLADKIHDILPPSIQEHLKPQALMGSEGTDTVLDSGVFAPTGASANDEQPPPTTP